MSKTTYYQRNREVNSKELLREREREQKINTENYLKKKI